MKILFDTSVLIAALVQPHPRHASALAHWERTRQPELQVILCAHTLAELYSVLTKLPVQPRVQPRAAWALISSVVERVDQIVALQAEDYAACIRRMSEMGLQGGVIYDALITHVARRENVDQVLTFNEKDFRRLWPEAEERIQAPQ